MFNSIRVVEPAASTTLPPTVSVPTPSPGESVPPDCTETVPATVPPPVSVPEPETAADGMRAAPARRSVPADTPVAPA